MNDTWMLERSIDELPLGVRTYNCLKNTEIKTVAELASKPVKELLKIKQLGRKGVLEIQQTLDSYGLNSTDALRYNVTLAAIELDRAQRAFTAAVARLNEKSP